MLVAECSRKPSLCLILLYHFQFLLSKSPTPFGIIKASQQIRGGHTFESKLFTFNILDRVGGGDAFASGLIYAMIRGYKPMDLINFAVASSVIKHTIHGDANITDDDKAIKEIMNQNFDIKR